MTLRLALAPLLLAFGLSSAALGACSDDGKPDVTSGSGGSGGGGGSGGSGGGSDASMDDAASDAGSGGYSPDGGLSPVDLGVIPTPRSADGGVSPADEQLAHLDTLAAGSRGVSLIRRWNALFAGPATPVTAEWTELEGIASLYHGAGRHLLLCLAITDGVLDARPNGLTAWNDAAAKTALEKLVDQTFATFGSELAALSFGHELDRWLAGASAADRAALVELVSHGVQYAKQSPAKPPGAFVGVTLTSDALVAAEDADVLSLLAASDAAVVTYYPLDSGFQIRPASTAAKDLDALTQVLAPGADAGEAGALEGGEGGTGTTPKPLLIQEVGYPSAAANGSSEQLQAAFYDSLFQALSSRRERFPFVAIRGLHDAPPATCAAEATALGASGNAAAESMRCSLGLKTVDGTAKPAWTSAVQALATFSAP